MGVILTDRSLGILILAAFALQGVFTVFSTGSLRLQKPEGGALPWAYNIVNLSTILVLQAIAGFCLLKGWYRPLAMTSFDPGSLAAAQVLGWAGLACYLLGNLVMDWGRFVLGASFRLGAVPPGEEDRLIDRGPFAVIRHPMYTGVLLMSLGLGLTLRSYVFLGVFALLLPLILTLIPTEEAQLQAHYGDAYVAYRQRTKRLLPFVY